MDKLLIVHHAANIAWISQLFVINMQDGNQSKNYWENPVFVALLIFSMVLQVCRWVKISKIKVDVKFESAVSLKVQLKSIVYQMFGRTPYLLKISPNENLLESSATSFMEHGSQKVVRSNITLQHLILNINNYKAINFVLILISGFYLYFGSLPSYAEVLRQIPFFSIVILWIASGIFLYSAAFFIFLLFLYFNRSK